MANRDYYDILGVGRGIGEEDIRKAYRKKAMEFHPDRNKSADAEEKFKEINEAYQVLTDSKKRTQYDRFGHSGVSANGGFDRPFDECIYQPMLEVLGHLRANGFTTFIVSPSALLESAAERSGSAPRP